MNELIAFIQSKIKYAEECEAARISMANIWECDSESDHEAGRILAQRMTGRKISPTTKESRKVYAEHERRIAKKYRSEREQFEAILAIIEARLSCQPQTRM